MLVYIGLVSCVAMFLNNFVSVPLTMPVLTNSHFVFDVLNKIVKTVVHR